MAIMIDPLEVIRIGLQGDREETLETFPLLLFLSWILKVVVGRRCFRSRKL
jgi:hypothetical protein